MSEQLGSPESEQRPRFHNLAVVTSTFYGLDPSSQLRAQLAHETVERLETLQLNSVVVEGGSVDEAFVKQLVSRDQPQVLSAWPAAKMGTSRRRGFELAFENPATEFVLWLEPEKADLLKEPNLIRCLELLRLAEGQQPNRPIILVPKRRSKTSYPSFQAEIETRGNREMTRLLGLDAIDEEFDFWFGPKFFNRAGGQFFTDYGGESWNSIFIPVAHAVKAGARLISTEVDFTYPPEQRAIEEAHSDEFRAKREAQYLEVIEGVKAVLAG